MRAYRPGTGGAVPHTVSLRVHVLAWARFQRDLGELSVFARRITVKPNDFLLYRNLTRLSLSLNTIPDNFRSHETWV